MKPKERREERDDSPASVMGVGEEGRRRGGEEEEERRGGGEDVRERSPLHEVGEGGWGGRGDEEEEMTSSRDRERDFRIRVRRSGSTAVRGPMVSFREYG